MKPRTEAHLAVLRGTRAQAAIRHVLANPDLSTVVVGVASLKQLGQALDGFEAWPLPGPALAEVEAHYAEGC